MQHTQLLCTFCTLDTIDDTVQQILDNHSVVFQTIYVLQNTDEPSELCCTYNVESIRHSSKLTPRTTISLHRKKLTNTLYTINALNLLVASLNGGKVDNNFKVTWEDYQNMILVTAQDALKKIPTKLFKIIKV
jgi:hypothetical protein